MYVEADEKTVQPQHTQYYCCFLRWTHCSSQKTKQKFFWLLQSFASQQQQQQHSKVTPSSCPTYRHRRHHTTPLNLSRLYKTISTRKLTFNILLPRFSHMLHRWPVINAPWSISSVQTLLASKRLAGFQSSVMDLCSPTEALGAL